MLCPFSVTPGQQSNDNKYLNISQYEYAKYGINTITFLSNRASGAVVIGPNSWRHRSIFTIKFSTCLNSQRTQAFWRNEPWRKSPKNPFKYFRVQTISTDEESVRWFTPGNSYGGWTNPWWVSEQSLTSHWTHNRSLWRRVFPANHLAMEPTSQTYSNQEKHQKLKQLKLMKPQHPTGNGSHLFWQKTTAPAAYTCRTMLFTARLLAGRMTTLWVRRPLSVSQHGQLSHPSLRGQ